MLPGEINPRLLAPADPREQRPEAYVDPMSQIQNVGANSKEADDYQEGAELETNLVRGPESIVYRF